MPPHANPTVEVTFAPTIILINVMRQFVRNFYSAVLGSRASDMLAMATHELLENALRYSAEEGATFKIEVERAPEADRVTIRIENRADAEHIEPLREVMNRMERAADPMAHYLALMTETAHRPEGSGLGLARLRAEAGMTLSLDLLGNRVCVIARTDVQKEEAA